MSAGRSPLAHQATSATAAATSHHGAEVSRPCSGLSTISLVTFLTDSVTSYQVVSAHRTASLTGPAIGSTQPAGHWAGRTYVSPTPAAASTVAPATRARPRPRPDGSRPSPPRPRAAAIVVRSNTTAMTTIASPAGSMMPTFWRDRPRMMSEPRPGAEMRLAMTTIDSAIMMVWLTASVIVERASGRCTLRSVCQPVAPSEADASTAVGETWSMASAVMRMAGGIA